MAKQTKKDEGSSTGTVVAVGAGVVALAAASYFFFGPEGKKNRNSLKGWMVKMKGEIIEKMEDAKDMSEAAYEKIVDAVAAKYAKAGKVSEAEIRLFAGILKQQWKGIVKAHNKTSAVKGAVKKVVSAAKKEVKGTPTSARAAASKSKK
ncbi:MAG: hypothetical protein ABIO57_02120 [Candidatus Paceibacterota bacterium]